VPTACQVNAPATAAPQPSSKPTDAPKSSAPQPSSKPSDTKPVQTDKKVILSPEEIKREELKQKVSATAGTNAKPPQDCSVAEYKELYSTSSGVKNCKEYPQLDKCEAKNNGPNGGLVVDVKPSEYYEYKDNGCVSKATGVVEKCNKDYSKQGINNAIFCTKNTTIVSAANSSNPAPVLPSGSIVGTPSPPAGQTNVLPEYISKPYIFTDNVIATYKTLSCSNYMKKTSNIVYKSDKKSCWFTSSRGTYPIKCENGYKPQVSGFVFNGNFEADPNTIKCTK
jgi:hypothetical protein